MVKYEFDPLMDVNDDVPTKSFIMYNIKDKNYFYVKENIFEKSDVTTF